LKKGKLSKGKQKFSHSPTKRNLYGTQGRTGARNCARNNKAVVVGNSSRIRRGGGAKRQVEKPCKEGCEGGKKGETFGCDHRQTISALNTRGGGQEGKKNSYSYFWVEPERPMGADGKTRKFIDGAKQGQSSEKKKKVGRIREKKEGGGVRSSNEKMEH